MRMNKKVAVVAAIASVFALSACEDTSGQSPASERENKSRLSTYERLVAAQPAGTMSYSPTRATKNFWIETWDEPGKLSYVYLLNGQGEPFGYYILEGLPVTYCVGLIPPYQVLDYRSGSGAYGNAFAVPGPSVDGTYSSGSNCATYYGKDAVTGAYIEYTAGFGINPFVYDQPAQQFADAQPLGDATLAKVKNQ